jgi:hypothetical protein
VGNIVNAGGDITSPPTTCAGPSHLIEFAPEWPTLDFTLPASRLLDCTYVQSRVCQPDIQEALDAVRQEPLGPERNHLLESLARRIKDDVLFIGVFRLFKVHGMAKDFEFQPRPDQQVKASNMKFTKQPNY